MARKGRQNHKFYHIILWSKIEAVYFCTVLLYSIRKLGGGGEKQLIEINAGINLYPGIKGVTPELAIPRYEHWVTYNAGIGHLAIWPYGNKYATPSWDADDRYLVC